LNRTRKLLAVCALALAAPVTLVACGDDSGSGGDEDPAEILRAAFSQDTEFDSGVVNIALNGSLEGTTSGSLDATVSGPFQQGAEGEPPELQLDADASVSAENLPQVPGGNVSFDFSGGFGLADDSLFVTYNDTTYEASQRLYSAISPVLESASSASESTSDPESADALIDVMTNLENDGTEDVEGEEVNHVSGDLDFASIAEEAAGSAPFDASQLEGLDATLDVYSSTEDDSFRRIDFTISAGDVEALSAQGIDGFDLTFSVGISDVNQEQTIEAPTDTQPLNELLKQFGTSESDLAQLFQGGLPIPITPGGTGVPDLGDTSGSGSSGGSSAAADELGDCIAAAGDDADAIAACLE
jgi:hypothetical protein